MKAIALLIPAIFVSLFLNAQNEIPETGIPADTLDTTEESLDGISPDWEADVVDYYRVMVVPFEPKLYRSDADKELYLKNDLTFAEIRELFRQGITESVFKEVEKVDYAAFTMISPDADVLADLGYIYKSNGYHFAEMPEEAPAEANTNGVTRLVEKVKDKVDPKPEPEPAGARIRNGQVYSAFSTTERYMNTKVLNPNMLDYLSNKYEVEYFVFINELDILIEPGVDWRAMETESYKRMIKVHYTILDRNGNQVYGGAAKNYFASWNNNISLIIKTKFPAIAEEIASHLPQPEQPETDTEVRKTQSGKKRSFLEHLIDGE